MLTNKLDVSSTIFGFDVQEYIQLSTNKPSTCKENEITNFHFIFEFNVKDAFK